MTVPLNSSLLGHDLSRRGFMRAALVGGGMLTLPHVMQLQAQAASSGKKRALILLWQDGGPTHFETFDPKPYAPSEYRGELDAISTTVPGVAYCEVLPRLARLAHRTAIVRSLHQPSSDHGSAHITFSPDGTTRRRRTNPSIPIWGASSAGCEAVPMRARSRLAHRPIPVWRKE